MTVGRSAVACGAGATAHSTAACAKPGTTSRLNSETAVLRMSGTFSSVPASVGSQRESDKPCARLFMWNVNIVDARRAGKNEARREPGFGGLLGASNSVLDVQLGAAVARTAFRIVRTVV